MDAHGASMDINKKTRLLVPGTTRPTVNFANYQDVPPGAFWGERRIPDFELILVIAGAFSYETREAAPLRVAAGDILLVQPGIWHTLRRLDKPAHAAFSCIHGELLPQARWAAGEYRFTPEPQRLTRTEGDAILHDLFRRCSDVYQGYDRYRAELLECILKEIWIRLAGYWQGGQKSTRASGRAQAMASFLRTYLCERITRRTLARAFSVTPEHVNALFRRELGVTPTQFIHRERVLRAHHLLHHNGLSVKEAATQVGFEDPLYFSRVFRRVLKRSPRSVR